MAASNGEGGIPSAVSQADSASADSHVRVEPASPSEAFLALTLSHHRATFAAQCALEKLDEPETCRSFLEIAVAESDYPERLAEEINRRCEE